MITTAMTVLFFLAPICVQAILLVRVFAVYPLHTLTRCHILMVYGVLLSVLVARTINLSFAIASIVEGSRHLANTYSASEVEWKLPNAKVEWCLQLFYDMYVLFLILPNPSGS